MNRSRPDRIVRLETHRHRDGIQTDARTRVDVTPRPRIHGGERGGEKGILVVLLQHDDRPSEFAALAVELVADVLA